MVGRGLRQRETRHAMTDRRHIIASISNATSQFVVVDDFQTSIDRGCPERRTSTGRWRRDSWARRYETALFILRLPRSVSRRAGGRHPDNAGASVEHLQLGRWRLPYAGDRLPSPEPRADHIVLH